MDDRRRAPLKPRSDVICRRLGDTAVLVDLATNEIFELNRTGFRVWELLVEGVGADALGERLQQEFIVDRQQLDKEIEELLAAFRKQRLITG